MGLGSSTGNGPAEGSHFALLVNPPPAPKDEKKPQKGAVGSGQQQTAQVRVGFISLCNILFPVDVASALVSPLLYRCVVWLDAIQDSWP